MNKIGFGVAALASLISTAALAGSTPPIPVSEPGIAGIVAGGVIAAIAFARLRAKK